MEKIKGQRDMAEWILALIKQWLVDDSQLNELVQLFEKMIPLIHNTVIQQQFAQWIKHIKQLKQQEQQTHTQEQQQADNLLTQLT